MSAQQAEMQAAVQEVACQQILDLAKQEEEKLDKVIQKLENMDEDDFEKLRAKRLEKMRRAHEQKIEWKFLGHGTYSEFPNQEAFFAAAKKSPRIIAHFYRGTTRFCEIVDAHMERLAPKHLETRFAKIDAEKAPYLVEKLNIFMMPTLVLIKDGQTVHHIRGFDEFGGTDKFSTEMFAFILSSYKMLNYEGPVPESPTGTGESSRGLKGAAAMRGAAGSSVREGLHERDYDEEDY